MKKEKPKLVILSPERWEEYRAIRLESLKLEPQAYIATYDDNNKRSEGEWISRLTYSHPADVKIGLEIGGQLVGLIASFWREEDPDSATINQVYISRKYRGRGLSKLLMNAVLEHISKIGQIKTVKLSVTASQAAALKSYLKAGFAEIGRKKNEVFFEGQFWDEIEMEKTNTSNLNQ